jgi:acetyltransferase-like isoleucine patch superfamily enzyme
MYLFNHCVGLVPFHLIRKTMGKHLMGFQYSKGSAVHLGTNFMAPKGFKIGLNSCINRQCLLDTRGGIEIGNHVTIGPRVVIMTADHDILSSQFKGRRRPVKIHNFAFIGTGAILLPGIEIGEGSVVAAGAVITKDTEPYTIYGGTPAKEIGVRQLESPLKGQAPYERWFH